MPDVAFRDTPRMLAERLCQIRKHPRHSKKDVFREVWQRSNAEKREHKECWEAKWQDRKENHTFIKDSIEQLIKVMEEQIQMLKSLIMLQTEALRTLRGNSI